MLTSACVHLSSPTLVLRLVIHLRGRSLIGLKKKEFKMEKLFPDMVPWSQRHSFLLHKC